MAFFVGVAPAMYRIYFWSCDQSMAISFNCAFARTMASPPLTVFEKTSKFPDGFDEYRISSPEAFHAPSNFATGSGVNWLLVPRSTSYIEILEDPAITCTASFLQYLDIRCGSRNQ